MEWEKNPTKKEKLQVVKSRGLSAYLRLQVRLFEIIEKRLLNEIEGNLENEQLFDPAYKRRATSL